MMTNGVSWNWWSIQPSRYGAKLSRLINEAKYMWSGQLQAARQIALTKAVEPKPGPGEVSIQLHQVGICGSDVHLYLGHRKVGYPQVIGHEGMGYIHQVGEGVSYDRIGERVVIEPNFPCLKCPTCLRGQGNICPQKGVLGLNRTGCFAEYVLVPEAFAHALPAAVADADAVVIEPTAVAYHALFNSSAKPGDTIVVIGLGAIGLLLTHVASRMGYRVLVLELYQPKIDLAIEQGAIPVPLAEKAEQQIPELGARWQAEGVRAVFECSGSAKATSLATAAAPAGAEIVLLGLSDQEATFQPLKTVRQGISIVPSLIYQHPFDFQRVIQLIVSKTIEPQFIISSYASLQELPSALERASRGKESKIIIRI